MKKKRFIYNNDGTFILGNSLHGGRLLSVEDVRDYVDIIAGSQVTSFFICTNASMPYYPSKVERYAGCLPPGETAGTANEKGAFHGEQIRHLAALGTDMITICAERARERGLEIFATMRMNDLHSADTTTSNLYRQGDFWLNHPECRIGEYPGRHADGALNFAHEAVQQYKLEMIKEICEKFDLDGLELDFMRMPVYFPYNQGEENIPRMNEFVRRARDIIDAAGKRRGKNMHMSVRIPRTLEHARSMGLAPDEWGRQGLVDFITASAYYIDEPALPIARLRRELVCDHIPIYANVDRRVLRPGCKELRSHDLYRAAAALQHKNGADGIYLFNHFFAPDNPSKNMQKPDTFDPNGIWERAAGVGPAQKLLSQLGTPESLCRRNKRYVLGTSNEEYGFYHTRELPCPLEMGKEVFFNHDIADEVDADLPMWAAMIVRTSKIDTAPLLKFHGEVLQEMSIEDVTAVFSGAYPLESDQFLFAFSVPGLVLKNGSNQFSLTSGTDGELLQADLCLAYT